MLTDQKAIERLAIGLNKHKKAFYDIEAERIVTQRARHENKDIVGILSLPLIDSKKSLEIYRNRAHERLKSLSDGLERIRTTITFETPQAETKLDTLISKHNLQGYAVKVEGSHNFIFMVEYPINSDSLNEMKESIIDNYKRTKEHIEKNHIAEKEKYLKGLPERFIETFNANVGTSALYCVGRSDQLKNVIKETGVYCVDVGPVEVKDSILLVDHENEFLPEPNNFIFGKQQDLAHFVKKFKN